MSHFHERSTCRVCGSAGLESVLNLGPVHISAFPAPDERDPPAIPLDLVRCRGTCGLLQLRHTARPDLLYKTYWYRSGTNQTMRDALADIAASVEKRVELAPADIVVDIGANDGTLLASYSAPGIRCIGFEPSNISAEARAKGLEIIHDYFRSSADGFDAIRGKAAAITSIAMFYGLEDPHAFVKDIDALLRPGGMWVIQLAYLPSILQRNAFDGICHEHLEYYSLSSIEYLLGQHGFTVSDAELVDINEGSIRLYVRRSSDPLSEPTARIKELRQIESQMDLTSAAPYQAFAARVEDIRAKLRKHLEEAKARGETVHAYGASTKGNTLLQYFGLGPDLVQAAWERQPQKWGRVTVASRIPIVSEEQGRAAKPDLLVVLPWHFAAEFVKREAEFLKSGGKMLLPLPEFKIVEAP